MRWDHCIVNFGPEVAEFASDYFAVANRKMLLIAGAGFDPRSRKVAECLVRAGATFDAVLIKENRPDPCRDIIGRANNNKTKFKKLLPAHQIIEIEIFGSDNAVIGGRNIVKELDNLDYADFTDIIVDISALSVGTSFPAIRYFINSIESGSHPENIHIFVTHNPLLDARITLIPSDSPGYVHGFRGGASLDRSLNVPKLWLPQLASGQKSALNTLHRFLVPDDTCPIVPFPASDPRQFDVLAEEYIVELDNSWSVDTRNLVYADESNSLDLYRTIIRLHDLRQRVFENIGGSLMILSPSGSKIMAIGALLAAIEKNLPVAYLEAIGYEMESEPSQQNIDHELVHLWLEGNAYPKPRPALGT